MLEFLLESIFELVGEFLIKFVVIQLFQFLQDLWNLTVNRF
jgi:hypothetical protein